MNKIFLGAVFGLTIMGSAGASIISRGFFDEAMENYATNTALDLKANQTDLTALSNKIGTLPSGRFPEFLEDKMIFSGLGQPLTYPTSLAELITAIYGNSETGAQGLLSDIIEGFPYDSDGDGNVDFHVGTLPNFALARDAFYKADRNATKIGTLPDGLTVANLYDGWIDSKGVIHNGLNDLSTITNNIDLSVEGPIAALMGYENGYKTRVKAVLNQLFMPIPEHPNLYNLVWHILEGGAFPKFAQEMYGIPGYKGLVDLTKGVGDLPSGNFPVFLGSGPLFPELNQPLTYPTSLAELINAIYGNLETGQIGLLAAIISGFPDTDGDGQSDSTPGILPNFWLATRANDLASANATKIGDLPTEYATVGAALTAMDAKITAKNLPSTSDDGQYVLTAKKVGETITYTWVKMDLTNEEQIQ